MSSPRKGISRGKIFPSRKQRGHFSIAKKMKKIRLTIIILTLLTPIRSGALEIRQEMYRYAMRVTQDVFCATFVITDLPRPGRLAMANCQLPSVHFQLGSAVLTLAEAEPLMAGLRKCRITPNTPLAVTGHSCRLGPEQINRDLSLQRARSVAGLLRDWGFTVAEVAGRGSQAPVTTDPQQLYLNRRVEVTADSRKDEVNPASQGR
jgi:outer membrane protein OmpA-like peptidoglycan-associated protein